MTNPANPANVTALPPLHEAQAAQAAAQAAAPRMVVDEANGDGKGTKDAQTGQPANLNSDPNLRDDLIKTFFKHGNARAALDLKGIGFEELSLTQRVRANLGSPITGAGLLKAAAITGLVVGGYQAMAWSLRNKIELPFAMKFETGKAADRRQVHAMVDAAMTAALPTANKPAVMPNGTMVR